MLTVGAKIFICHSPVDLRKGFEGLSTIASSHFNQNIVASSAYFVFINRSRDRMKILYWDNDGLAIWYKRLERGRFPKRTLGKPTLERREFFMLLEGIIPKRLCKRYKS